MTALLVELGASEALEVVRFDPLPQLRDRADLDLSNALLGQAHLRADLLERHPARGCQVQDAFAVEVMPACLRGARTRTVRALGARSGWPRQKWQRR